MKDKKNWILIGVLVGSILLDQLTKYGITQMLFRGQSLDVIPGFFRFTYVQNTGAAWSIFEGRMTFFYIITLVALALFAFYLYTIKNESMWPKIGLILMISGTIGNFIDRLSLQYVRDFLDFVIIGYDFPVFNVADMCLVIGVGLILIDELLKGFGERI